MKRAHGAFVFVFVIGGASALLPLACSSSSSGSSSGGGAGDAGADVTFVVTPPPTEAGTQSSEDGSANEDAGSATQPIEPVSLEGGGPDADPVPACSAYCTGYAAVCGANPSSDASTNGYLDSPTCLALCAALPVGIPNDTTQDTLACRVSQYPLPPPSQNCPAGGPFGLAGTGEDGGLPYGQAQCGASACETFCSLAVTACSGDNAPSFITGTGYSDCIGVCQELYTFNPNAPISANDDSQTLNCRFFHLQAAFTDPVHNCPDLGYTVQTASDGGEDGGVDAGEEGGLDAGIAPVGSRCMN